MEHAKGDFIYSMDDDDVIMPDGLQILIDHARKTKADVIINTKRFRTNNDNFERLDEISALEISTAGKKNVVASDLKQRVWEEYVLGYSRAAPWSHFYGRDFLERSELRYPPMAVHDDGEFLIELMCSKGKIVKIEEPFYIWRKRAESITNSTKQNLDGTPSFDGFAKRIRSFLIMMERIDEVLSKAMMREYGEVDWYFIDTVCLRIKDRALISTVHLNYEVDAQRSWQLIREAIEERYGTKTSMFRRMMYGYFGEFFTAHKQLQEYLVLREKMKALKEVVNKVIPY